MPRAVYEGTYQMTQVSKWSLFHNDVFIGEVTNTRFDDVHEMSGDIALTTEFERYAKVFDYLLANDGLTDGSPQPFDDSMYEGWCLIDAAGTRKEIDMPAIEDGEVRWRD